MPNSNRQVRLKSRPDGIPRAEHFEIVETPLPKVRAGEVIASRHPGYAEGDRVMGMLGWQDYAVSDGGAITRKVTETDLPLSLSLGALSLNGVDANLCPKNRVRYSPPNRRPC